MSGHARPTLSVVASEWNIRADRPSARDVSEADEATSQITDSWRRFIAALNANALDEVADVIDERFVDHNVPAHIPPGLEGLRLWWADLHEGFDLRVDVEDIVVGGDRLASRMTFRGVHMGTFRGHAPTGKVCVATFMSIDRFDHGRLLERWQVGDELSMLTQLGILEAPY